MPVEPQPRFQALADTLEVLASAARLDLLQLLQTPRALHEIHLLPVLTRKGERPGRPLSRQAVKHHLQVLVGQGLVVPLAEAHGERFSLNHQRLFALIDELRRLTRLRPLVPLAGPGTVDRASAGAPQLPPRPRLAVAYGRDEGACYSLEGPVGTRWRIGRAKGCEIQLDYDPFLSATNSFVQRRASDYCVYDGGSRNGTHVNWERVGARERRRLEAGDLILSGRTLLAFQP